VLKQQMPCFQESPSPFLPPSQPFSQSFKSFLPTSLTNLILRRSETTHFGHLLRFPVRLFFSLRRGFFSPQDFQGKGFVNGSKTHLFLAFSVAQTFAAPGFLRRDFTTHFLGQSLSMLCFFLLLFFPLYKEKITPLRSPPFVLLVSFSLFFYVAICSASAFFTWRNGILTIFFFEGLGGSVSFFFTSKVGYCKNRKKSLPPISASVT